MRLWDTRSGTQVTAFEGSGKPISACAVSPDGQHLLSACLNGFLVRWDASAQEALSRFVTHARPIAAIVFSADGQHLATASWDRNLMLCDAHQECDGRLLAAATDGVYQADHHGFFAADGRLLVPE